MGYCTRFYLTAEDRSGAVRKKLDSRFINGLGLARDFGDADDELWVRVDDIFALCEGESCKWYGYNEEMTAVSLKHPHVLFTLDGEGEEPGDIWRCFYLAGTAWEWRPDTTPPEFDDYIETDPDDD